MYKTREQFESEYNGGDIMPMVLRGRLSIECHCAEDMCTGWKMSHLDWMNDDMQLYGNTSSEVSVATTHRWGLLRQHKLDGKKID